MVDFVFPQSEEAGAVKVSKGGMTLRDYYAGQALASIVVKYPVITEYGNQSERPAEVARCAWDYADAMMEERGKRVAK